MSLLKEQPQSLVDIATSLLKEFRSTESLHESIKKWVNENRQEYYYKYGIEEAERLLEVRAFIMQQDIVKTSHKNLALNENCPEEKKDDNLVTLHNSTNAQSGLPELGEEEKKEEPEDKKIAENYASPEPSSAIGFKEGVHNPKHADVLHDVTMIGGLKTECYRILLQYPDGNLGEAISFVPSIEQPGAPTIESLWAMTSGIPDKYGAIREAIGKSLDLPSEQPQFKGNDRK